MTIEIVYTSGRSETFLGCSDYTNDGRVVRFLMGEVVVEINWASVQKIVITKP